MPEGKTNIKFFYFFFIFACPIELRPNFTVWNFSSRNIILVVKLLILHCVEYFEKYNFHSSTGRHKFKLLRIVTDQPPTEPLLFSYHTSNNILITKCQLYSMTLKIFANLLFNIERTNQRVEILMKNNTWNSIL